MNLTFLVFFTFYDGALGAAGEAVTGKAKLFISNNVGRMMR